jgi:signal transduction histidine kinase
LCLKADDDGTLWIGTGSNGLVRYRNGRFAHVGVENGLPSNVVCHIAEDRSGFFWLSTHRGLVRIAREELDRCANGTGSPTISLQAFDRDDGLPTIEFSAGLEAAGCQSPDGRMWFTSGKGVVEVDPARLHANPQPPPVIVENVQVDRQTQGLPKSGELRLRPDHERIEFQYTALSLTAPGKVRFKYRLDGIDKNWVDAGTKRIATYSRLPAGDYTFRVIACNNDGVWNAVGASLKCAVTPFFWQRWWFIAVVAIAVLGVVVWTVRHLTRRRMQRRLEALERQHAIERERARIARDIHDDIGATLTRITMLSQCLPRESAQNGAAAVVEQIFDTARDATRALDEIVWAVNPRHDSLEGLVTYMGKFAQDYLAALNVRCRLELPVQLPDWPLTADVRHNLFLAFKEALNNTVKHAEASEVTIVLRVDDVGYTLEVRDNGRGLSADGTRSASRDRASSGNGLENLRRRLAAIGGSCEITSVPGRGTNVSFRVDRNARVANESLSSDRPPVTSAE